MFEYTVIEQSFECLTTLSAVLHYSSFPLKNVVDDNIVHVH